MKSLAVRQILLCSLFHLILWQSESAQAQVSPGPLSKAHSGLNGLRNCTSCHSLGGGAARFKCVECHKEILQSIQENKGYHARVIEKNKGGQDCVRCHGEHYGEDFSLIRWEPSREGFDHKQAGYPLLGKHAALECSRCHNPSHISALHLRNLQARDLKKTYLGLSQNCVACHKDAHNGQLNQNCASCHGFQSWKETHDFDHQTISFPLTGLHQQVACQKCHLRTENGMNVARYKGIPFARCSDCHRDPHQGAFQTSCQSCHTTGGWKQVKQMFAFDHRSTTFPLKGMHLEVACAKCHFGSNFKQPLPHEKCIDCHRKDPHDGQFAHRVDHGECGSCHTEKGFKPTLFSFEQHQKSDYPLAGKHETVDCAKCHIPKGSKTLYRLKHEACLDCHKDIHEGQFAGTRHQNHCDSCHTVQGFQPSTYTFARHRETQFQLTDGHAAVPCMDCHKRPAHQYPLLPVQYKFAILECQTCHEDPHQGQFAAQSQNDSATAGNKGCLSCHNLKTWKDVVKFDHAKTKFPLMGAHRVVACADCHRPDNLGRSVQNVRFKSAPQDCAGCHEDVHAGQFSLNGRGTDCTSCHDVSKWKPSKFDHEKKARFSLAGAHQFVSCRLCHKAATEIEGRAVLIYRQAPRQCAACHSNKS